MSKEIFLELMSGENRTFRYCKIMQNTNKNSHLTYHVGEGREEKF